MPTRQQIIRAARNQARQYRIPERLFLSLLQAESGFNPGARSPAGAFGLAQLMPATARGLGVNPANWRQNLAGGARYLSQQFKTFGEWPLALAAYNAGPGAVRKYGGVPPYAETQAYVKSVLGGQGAFREQALAPPAAPAVPDAEALTKRREWGLKGLEQIAAGTFSTGDAMRAILEARQWGGTLRAPRRNGRLPGVGDARTPPVVQRMLSIAHAQIGKPYVWGGESPSEGGFDCSGLVEYVFEQAGIKTPGRLTSQSILGWGRSVPGGKQLKGLQPFDMIVTNGGRHVVLYIGGGKVIAAPHTGAVTQYQPVSRFRGDIVDVRRVL